MQGLVRRYHQVGDGVGLVDIMGKVLSGTLLTEDESIEGKDEEGGKKKKYLKLARPEDIKLSRQRRYFWEGENPMPIYCVVRNEVPVEKKGMDVGEEDVAGKEKDRAEKESAQKKESYFQWFEFTPFEVGSEEFNGWSFVYFVCFIIIIIIFINVCTALIVLRSLSYANGLTQPGFQPGLLVATLTKAGPSTANPR